MTFPVVVLALAVVLLAGSLGQAAVACADGARAAARALSRGETAAVADGEARAVIGRPATVSASGGGGPAPGLVRVDVEVRTASVTSVGPGSWQLPVRCSAHAWTEPDG